MKVVAYAQSLVGMLLAYSLARCGHPIAAVILAHNVGSVFAALFEGRL